MTAENEIVMVGGTSYSTGEVFSTMKVMTSSEKDIEKISPFLFMKMSSHSDLFKVLNASLSGWIDNFWLFGGSVYDAIVLPIPKKILKSCKLGPVRINES